jgi:hypothetical protein
VKPTLKSLLFEENSVPPEAPEDAIYGKYLFAPYRDSDGLPKPLEPNTSDENKLRHALKTYFMDNISSELGKIAPQVLGVLAKHQYEPVLDPGNKKVYRILSLEGYMIEDIVATTGKEMVYNEVGSYQGTYNLRTSKPSQIQGWTTEPLSTAVKPIADYAQREKFMLGHGIVLFVAYPEGNKFFGKPYKLADVVEKGMRDEHETISFGTVRCVGFSYYLEKYVPGMKKKPFNYEDLVEKAVKIS